MKEKILFMVINMNVGGVEKALINQLKIMSPQEYSIKILMLEKYGGFLDQIPNWIEIDYLPCYKDIKEIFNISPKNILKKFFKEKEFIKSVYYSIVFCICKLQKHRNFLLEVLFKKYPNYIDEYDEAIAYAGPMSIIDYYIINKVKAKKKISWIHFDVSTIGIDKNLIKKTYKNFNEIRVVSKDSKKKFDNIFPQFKNKTKVFYNVILKDEILKLSEEKGFEDDYKGIRLLTVGRISREKGQDLGIKALKKLLEIGIDAKLYLIGDGNFRKECELLGENLKISKNITFLGTKINPYPYMRECDIYIQPSRYEGYCITLAEALIFNKKIVATKFTGALEQLKDNSKSVVVNYDSQDIYEGIKKLLKI